MTMPSNKWEEAIDKILRDLHGYEVPLTGEVTLDADLDFQNKLVTREIETAKLALTNAVKELVETAKPEKDMPEWDDDDHVYSRMLLDKHSGFIEATDTYQTNLLKAIGDKE